MSFVPRTDLRGKRRQRIRRRISGSQSRPRACVMVSNKRIYVQFVDDVNGRTLAAVSTLDKEFRRGKTVADAHALGQRAAKAAKEKGIERVVFDRGGFLFHGRVKAVADAMREGGLKF